MGDIIEITTVARNPTSFYRVSSSCFSFEVKAHSAALLGLAKEPGSTCNYWFGFGQVGKVWIKGSEGLKTSHGGNYSVAPNHFKRFWIAWDCGILRIGQGRENSCILTYPNNVVGLNYVTFSTQDLRHPATWKFELPPASLINIASNPSYKKIQGGELRWTVAEDVLPDDSVIGGFQAECVYIIRANHVGSLTPGKFVPSEGVAYVAWGGAANVVPEFEILCGYNYTWEATSDDKIPVNAFVAGFSEANHEKLYIGRVKHMNCVVPGKVQASHKVCYVAFADRELPFKNYEILTVPELDPYAARLYLETNIDARVLRHVYPNIADAFALVQDNENIENDEEDEENISEEEG